MQGPGWLVWSWETILSLLVPQLYPTGSPALPYWLTPSNPFQRKNPSGHHKWNVGAPDQSSPRKGPHLTPAGQSWLLNRPCLARTQA